MNYCINCCYRAYFNMHKFLSAGFSIIHPRILIVNFLGFQLQTFSHSACPAVVAVLITSSGEVSCGLSSSFLGATQSFYNDSGGGT